MTDHRLDWIDGQLFCDLVALGNDELQAARELLGLKMAVREDSFTTYRGETPCLKANIGWAADHTVREDSRRSPVFVKYRPFPVTR